MLGFLRPYRGRVGLSLILAAVATGVDVGAGWSMGDDSASIVPCREALRSSDADAMSRLPRSAELHDQATVEVGRRVADRARERREEAEDQRREDEQRHEDE